MAKKVKDESPNEFIQALDELENTKGISKDTLLKAIEDALISAYKRHYGNNLDAKVEMDPNTGKVTVYSVRTVVDELSDPEEEASEILLSEALEKDPSLQVGDVFEEVVDPKGFGRIAAQTAKQVVVQRIHEAERSIVYDKYADKENNMLSAVVHRIDHGNIYVDLDGSAEGIIPASEAVPSERLNINERVRVYVVEVKRTNRGPQIIVSRTHPALVRKLFEMEVPEIMDGIVQIESVAREPGARTKIAVSSNEKNVDPVGACVGPKGSRIERVVEELNGEKIDVIPWSDDPTQFIANALRPAKVIRVRVNEADKTARVVVPDYQLSLAIGKEGQNARLAAKLTGWKVDIKSKSQADAEGFGEDDLQQAVPDTLAEQFDLVDRLNDEDEQEQLEQDLILDDLLGLDSLNLDEEPVQGS